MVGLYPWKMFTVAIQTPIKMGHLKNCEELHAVAYNHRNNVVMLCLTEETLRFSPKKEFLGSLVSLWCALGSWCPALLLSPCGLVGLEYPKWKKQSSMVPSMAVDGARAGVQRWKAWGWGWGWFRGGLRGGSKQPGLGPHITGLSMQSIGQARDLPITLFAALCRWSRSSPEVHCFGILCKCSKVSFYWSL